MKTFTVAATISILAVLSLSQPIKVQQIQENPNFAEFTKSDWGKYIEESFMEMSQSKPATNISGDEIDGMRLPDHFSFKHVNGMIQLMCELNIYVNLYVDWQDFPDTEWRSLTLSVYYPGNDEIYFYFVTYDEGPFVGAGYDLNVMWN